MFCTHSKGVKRTFSTLFPARPLANMTMMMKTRRISRMMMRTQEEGGCDDEDEDADRDE